MRSVVPASLLAFVLVATALAPSARADEASDADAAATTRVYYGWQNLGVDAASIGVLALGLRSDGDTREGLAWASLGVYALGAPIVHLAHGHYRRAAGSFALRAGLPLVFAGVTGALIGGSGGGGGVSDGAGLVAGSLALGAVGAVIAVFVDDVGLSWDERPARPTWTPSVQPSPYGMTFGVAGSF